MTRASTELVVVGAGPGGYVAAIRAAQRGLKVTLVDAEAVGGTCLNVGCIPSKALITASDLSHSASNAEEMGLYGDIEVDASELVSWKDGIVDQLTSGVESLCLANGVELLEGRASFVDGTTMAVEGPAEVDELEFEQAILATGSRPIEVPGFEFNNEPVWSSRDALDPDPLPDRLVVVGAGYIGMELSIMLAKLGVDVTVIEMLDSVLPAYGPDLTAPVREAAEDLGITFNFGEAAAGWEYGRQGIVVKTETEDGTTHSYRGDAVLVAVGRQPVTDTLNLEAVGMEPVDSGFIETDEKARTSADHIFAVGDVAGEPMLAHKASQEGIVAAEVAAGNDATLDYRSIPAAVFTDPEIGTVGVGKREAEEADMDVRVGHFPFRASGRALTTGKAEGFVRIVADAHGTVVGGEVVGPEASELIAELGLAIEQGLTLDDVGETIHAHPTLAEAVMEAAEHAEGQAIHTTND